jgi:hypothetical protein
VTWNPITQPVDYVLLAGARSPGIAELVNADNPREWTKQQGYGLTGQFAIFRGLVLSVFSVKIRLYTEADWDAWNVWIPGISAPPTPNNPTAFDIWHPQLEALGIKSVFVINIKQGVQEDDGVWVHEIELSDYRPRPKLSLIKPEGSKSGPASVDPYDREIDRLRGEKQQQDLALDPLTGAAQALADE